MRRIMQWLPVAVVVAGLSSCKKDHDVVPASSGSSPGVTQNMTEAAADNAPDSIISLAGYRLTTQEVKTTITTVGTTSIYSIAGKNAFFFNAGLTVAAEGAPNAFNKNDAIALDYLSKAGKPGDWWSLVTDNGQPNGNPLVQPSAEPAPGYYISSTALSNNGFSAQSQWCYVNAANIPYIALPPSLGTKAKLGDFAAVLNKKTGALSYAIFADEGEEGKVGRASINAAAKTGINSNPKSGGTTAADLIYIVFPNSGNGFGRSAGEIRNNGKKLLSQFGGGAYLMSQFGVTTTTPPPATTTPATTTTTPSTTTTTTTPTTTTTATTPTTTTTPPVVNSNFKVVGYLADWSGDVNQVQYSKLTHINYSFINTTASGSLSLGISTSRLSSVVSLAHAKGVKVCIAIGGWNNGDDSNFESMAASSTATNTFINNVVNFVTTYNLDGADIDWEYPNTGSSATNYANVMKALSAALHANGKTLSAAVVSDGSGGAGVLSEVFGYVDMLNVMAYDGGTPHSPYSLATTAISYWTGRGCAKGKIMLGVPFYGRDPETTYSDLVAQDASAPNKDQVGTVYYNGIKTIQDKTRLAMQQAGGIMIWEISQDATGAASLLSAINNVVTGLAFIHPLINQNEVGPLYPENATAFDFSGAGTSGLPGLVSEVKVMFNLKRRKREFENSQV
jgi:GH18 family chitinase